MLRFGHVTGRSQHHSLQITKRVAWFSAIFRKVCTYPDVRQWPCRILLSACDHPRYFRLLEFQIRGGTPVHGHPTGFSFICHSKALAMKATQIRVCVLLWCTVLVHVRRILDSDALIRCHLRMMAQPECIQLPLRNTNTQAWCATAF